MMRVRPIASGHAEVAQLVEHRTENAGVPSSSLGLGTKHPNTFAIDDWGLTINGLTIVGLSIDGLTD
jgi:hypothetical protein